MITTRTGMLDLQWDLARAQSELEFYRSHPCGRLALVPAKRNYLVKYFQQDVFYAAEKDMWSGSRELRDWIITNRVHYLGVDQDRLTTENVLSAFKIMGLHYGYSHFNPLWFKWFVSRYGVKSCYDPCGGWGHRLLGGLGLDKYAYNDLSEPTRRNVDRMIDALGIENAETTCEDARTFTPRGEFDAMFTCPPYFNVEKYPCGGFADRLEFNRFMDSLFDVFDRLPGCRTFGIVVREDLLGRGGWSERFPLNVQASHLTDGKKRRTEYLYVFKKGPDDEKQGSMRETGHIQDDPPQLRESREDKGQGPVLGEASDIRRRVRDEAAERVVRPVEWDEKLNEEIRELVEKFPRNFSRMIESKGFKGRYEDRSRLAEYVRSATPLLDDPFYTVKTKVYWILHRMEDFPKCEICGKPVADWNVKKLKDPYRRFCSAECQYACKATQDKIRSTCRERYGTDNVFQRRDIMESIASRQDEIKRKKYLTHKKNNSFHTSSGEIECNRMIAAKYPDVIPQYTSDAYPFQCDFYIPSIDTYVEYQGSWTHGGHPFDPASETDLAQLAKWRSKNTAYYDNAIETWTVRDVRKRSFAAQAKLNYVELWSIDDAEQWLKEKQNDRS